MLKARWYQPVSGTVTPVCTGAPTHLQVGRYLMYPDTFMMLCHGYDVLIDVISPSVKREKDFVYIKNQ